MEDLLYIAVNIVTVPLLLLSSFVITVLSAVVIIGGAGSVVLSCRLLRILFRPNVRMQRTILDKWFSIFMGHCEHLGGFTLRVTGDVFREDETAVIVCNHRSWMDTVVLFSLARQVGRNGDLKYLAKKSLLLFPVFGLIGAVTDSVVFIERSAQKATAAMSKVYRRLTDKRRRDLPFWLIIYPEGTRRTPAKLAAARDFAKKRDLRPLDHVLQPRTKGFVGAAQALRGSAGAIYDVTVAYGDNPEDEVRPSFLRMYFTTALRNRVVHVHQRRIPMDSVPKDEKDAKLWLYKLFEQKDTLIDGYYKNKKFEGTPMRWNRMTIGQWFRSLFYCFTVAAAYCASLFLLFRQIIRMIR